MEEVGTFGDEDNLNIRPLTLAKYNGYDFIIFFDTGAPRNICSKRTYDLFFSHIDLQPTDELGLCDIQGGSLKVIGKIKLEFELAGVLISEDVYISKGIQLVGHVLLGFQAMVKNQIRIDPTVDGVII